MTSSLCKKRLQILVQSVSQCYERIPKQMSDVQMIDDMSLRWLLLLISDVSFSLAFVSIWIKMFEVNINHAHDIQMNHLRLCNHFLRPNLPCAHFENFLPCLLWILWIWLSNDSHFAFINSPSLAEVEETHQYKWLIMLFCHSPTTSQFFCLPSFSNFLRKPVKIL